MTRKIFSLLLAFVFIFALAGCGKNTESGMQSDINSFVSDVSSDMNEMMSDVESVFDNNSSNGEISEEKAKDIALSHANINKSDANFTKSERDYENGEWHYDIEFTAKGKKYDYEISAKDGKVIAHEVDND